MHYADIKPVDVSNGPGVRVSVFVSGCTHFCKNCFNSEAWSFSYGKPFTKETINKILELLSPDYISGLSILGGEPFHPYNQKDVLTLVKTVKEKYPEKSIWCYTGYDYDKEILGPLSRFYKEPKELLKYIDILVDGRFEEDKKDLRLKFRGSSNQRIIDIKKSLQTREVIIWDKLKEGE